MRRLALAVLIVPPLLVLAGCGSSGAKALPKATYIAKADAVCAHTDTEVNQNTSATSVADISSALTKLKNIYASYQSQERALATPQPDHSRLVSKWLDPSQKVFSAGVALFPKIETAAKSGNTAALESLEHQLDSVDSSTSSGVTAFLKSYGLSTCSQLESTS